MGGRKQPIYIHRRDGQPLAFAGLWERWQGAGEPMETCTVLTTEPNELMAPIHDRMPVIVDPRDYAVWLDLKVHDDGQLARLLQPWAAERLMAYPVSPLVNSPTTTLRGGRNQTKTRANCGIEDRVPAVVSGRILATTTFTMPNVRQAIQKHLDDNRRSTDQLVKAFDGRIVSSAVQEFVAGTATLNTRELGLVMDVLGEPPVIEPGSAQLLHHPHK